MATYNKFQQFAENLGKGVHNFTSDATSTLTVALTNTLPVATNAVLADITEIAYTNLSARVFANVTAEHTTGTVTLAADDLVLTASGTVATFRYVVIYDDDPTSPANPLICWWDRGSSLTMEDTDTFTVDLTGGIATWG